MGETPDEPPARGYASALDGGFEYCGATEAEGAVSYSGRTSPREGPDVDAAGWRGEAVALRE